MGISGIVNQFPDFDGIDDGSFGNALAPMFVIDQIHQRPAICIVQRN